MSGDHGLNTTIPAVINASQQFPQHKFILVGQQHVIQAYLTQHKLKLNAQISMQHCTQVVEMGELPSSALRNKKDSSMRVAINLVKEQQAHAAVSAGNTGALMATARFVLKMIEGLDRPAIIAALPTTSGKPVHVLDLGANVNCSAEQLLQFAMMGTIACQAIDQIAKPTVRLLNIGEEEIKGNDLVKEATTLIQANPQINFQGYIESDQIFKGGTDVVVCDGFVGNAVLKAAEGVVKTMGNIMKEAFNKSIWTKLRGAVVYSLLKKSYKTLDPEVHNGSPLLGLKGTVVKSHGSASSKAFYHAIKQAIEAVEHQLPEQIEKGLKTLGTAEHSV